MQTIYTVWDRADRALQRWLIRHSIRFLRIALGAVFLGFGVLKFFPNLSPAQSLAERTLHRLTFGLAPMHVGVVLIALLECVIGLMFITDTFLRVGVWLLCLEMIGVLSPLILFPGELFSGPHHAPSLEGQYVIKDVILIGAGLVIAATLNGGRLATSRKSMPQATPVATLRPTDDARPGAQARAR